MLRSWRELLLEAKAEFATILRQQTGKSESEALGYELFFVCDAIGYWGRAAGRLLADRQPILHLFKHKRALSTHKPRGVVGLVASDRLPLLLTLGEAVPALMAGNGVILLPPATADGAALLGCALAEEAGFPPGLLRAVTGTEAVVLDLVGHADMVAYTGVADLGRRVSVRAAEQLKPSVLELEASDPMIVCRDADLDRAARACVWRATSPAAA
jgi:succinate-semialdehyde dehydrogenase/glutarate-semialdehyde dehydrogenase